MKPDGFWSCEDLLLGIATYLQENTMPNYPQALTFFNRQWRRAFKPDFTVSLGYYTGDKTWTNSRAAGFQNSSWREQVSRHSNAGTHLSGSKFVIRGSTKGRVFFALEAKAPGVTPQRLTWEVLGDILTDQQISVVSPYADSATRAQALNLALMAFYDKAWECIRSFESGTFLGEVRESLSMIRSPGKSLRKGVDSYVVSARKRARRASSHNGRRNPRNSRSVGQALSDTWLEYAFGWRPLISDVKSGAAAFARLAANPVEYQTFTVTRGAEQDLITQLLAAPQSVLLMNQMRYWFSTQRYYGQISVRYKGEVRVRVESPAVFREDVLGFTWENFAPTAWELIPYSFLVDYFSNIGEVISAWSFPRSRLTWWNRSIQNRAVKNLLMKKRPTPNPNTTDYKIVSDSGPDLMVELERSSFTRDQEELGIPTVTLTIPGYGLKWLNIAALAGSRYL